MVVRRVVIAQPPAHAPQHPIDQETESTTSRQILPIPNPVTSYWLSEPHEYANLRSTPDLPEQCDIAIIGSGMSGVLTAYHILQSSASSATDKALPKIVLLEARQLCAGATARNGGHAKIKTATLAGLPDDKSRNEFQGYVLGVIDELKRIVDDEGLAEHCEFELRRSFDVFQSASELAPIKAIYDASLLAHAPWTKHVAYLGPSMATNVTSISPALGAFSCPAASFWPYKLVTALLSILVHRYPGYLNVQTTTPVTRISSSSTPGKHTLHTPRGTLTPNTLILATNAYTPGLLPSFASTITPVKGMACHISSPRDQSAIFPHLNNTYNIHYPPGVDYLNPRPDGGIVVGGGSWLFRGDEGSWKGNFDDGVGFGEGVERYWGEEYMGRTFLGWEGREASPDCIWVGIMGYTDDGLPHVGRVPGEKNMWMLAGFNGGGMALIAKAAKAIAKMVVEDLGFEDVKEEFGLLEGIGTNEGRMREG